ncbi:uncharacterized protein PpBr36_11423 [Pyricularia pennisetigena]|uniref:uncharacterized protein n=1 Tax=Pyricularia pennisetigena TaxID=1578925 RepID=UPI00114D600B|nr:uncharacterized protein PpBr36_11423 [Pyricularia pennisetigena]TLS20311.1 hypothetical protein PpBr36_11423 [Pyricularia pennisetigena]
MEKSELGITDASKTIIRALLESEQKFPIGTPFDDNVFADTYPNPEGTNEARVIQDVSRLIFPSTGMSPSLSRLFAFRSLAGLTTRKIRVLRSSLLSRHLNRVEYITHFSCPHSNPSQALKMISSRSAPQDAFLVHGWLAPCWG